jgi:hypothetical protein
VAWFYFAHNFVGEMWQPPSGGQAAPAGNFSSGASGQGQELVDLLGRVLESSRQARLENRRHSCTWRRRRPLRSAPANSRESRPSATLSSGVKIGDQGCAEVLARAAPLSLDLEQSIDAAPPLLLNTLCRDEIQNPGPPSLVNRRSARDTMDN